VQEKEFEELFGLITSGDFLLMDLGSFLENPKDHQTAMFYMLQATRTDEDGLLDGFHPLAFVAKANVEDTPNFYMAMNNEAAAEGFYNAMEEEYDLLRVSLIPGRLYLIVAGQAQLAHHVTWLDPIDDGEMVQ